MGARLLLTLGCYRRSRLAARRESVLCGARVSDREWLALFKNGQPTCAKAAGHGATEPRGGPLTVAQGFLSHREYAPLTRPVVVTLASLMAKQKTKLRRPLPVGVVRWEGIERRGVWPTVGHLGVQAVVVRQETRELAGLVQTRPKQTRDLWERGPSDLALARVKKKGGDMRGRGRDRRPA
jgi:hypothetical protein